MLIVTDAANTVINLADTPGKGTAVAAECAFLHVLAPMPGLDMPAPTSGQVRYEVVLELA